MLKKKKISKKGLIILLLSIISIVLLIYYFTNDNDYTRKLIDSSKAFVYTYKDYSTSKFTKKIPHINLNILDVNEEIDNFVLDYVNKDDNIINYKYSISNNVLSLVIRIISFDGDRAPFNYFKSFNINLDTLKEASSDEVLNAFNITSEDVLKKIEKEFNDYYYDLVFQEKINEQVCNLECFLQRRGFLGYMQDVNYYIDNGKLIVYKPFIINTSSWEYEYFKDCDFSFEVVG